MRRNVIMNAIKFQLVFLPFLMFNSCGDRIIGLGVIEAYDGNASTYSVDAGRNFCCKVDGTGDDATWDCKVETYTAHFLKVRFKNNYPQPRKYTEGSQTIEGQESGEAGYEHITEYTITYSPMAAGIPSLPSQTVSGPPIVIGPGETVEVDHILLVDFKTKHSYYNDSNYDPEVPARYAARYTFKGRNDAEYEMNVDFFIGNFDNCGVFGDDYTPYITNPAE